MIDPDLSALVRQRSSFTLVLLTFDEARMDERTPHAVHEQFLKPLLARADACWVYGIEKGSELWRLCADLLTPEKGKCRLALGGDVVTGREPLWNASGGKRGTIVVTVPLSQVDSELLFTACHGIEVVVNYRSAHTPAAISFARKQVERQSHAVFCFPRNNGIEWVDVFAPAAVAEEWFHSAVGP